MLKGVIFDWDGVIIDSAPQHKKSWELLSQEMNKPLPKFFFENSFGSKNSFIIPNIFCWTFDPKEIQQISDRKEQLYREVLKNEPPTFIPGVLDFLGQLQEQKFPAAIATSTDRKNVHAIFEIRNLAQFFQSIIASEDVRVGKPDPEIFLKAAESLSIEPQEAIVFEDSPAGIKAGLTAGMKVVGISTSHPSSKLQQAHVVINDFIHLNIHQLIERFQEVENSIRHEA